jgi:O-antigen/teichoic acid export membrane protein
MFNVAGILYLGSRVAAAAGNLLAVMIFTRLAGAAEYGHYLLIFAWSLIAYGFGAQWMRYAYFGVFHPERFDEYVGSLARLLGGGLLIAALIFAALGWFGLFEADFLAAVFALVFGITVYEAAFEVARTRLAARAAAFSMLMRTVFTLALGSAALLLGGGARELALAIALAHIIAALPSLATFGGVPLARGSRTAALHILTYGWPLLLSFGVNAASGSVDRLLIAHYVSNAALGSYGVVADLMRQTFIVFGDAIILSLVTVAKRHANEGDTRSANEALQKAFNACLAAASLGAAFFIVFGEPVLSAILKPEYIVPARELIPLFAVAFAFSTMRSYYFAQVIYFTHASYAELMIAILSLIISTALSVVLIPSHGAWGAAVSLMLTCIFVCLAYVWLGRRWYRLPIDLAGLSLIPALAVLFVFGAHVTTEAFPSGSLPLVLDGFVFALCALFAVRRFGLMRSGAAVPVGSQLPAS